MNPVGASGTAHLHSIQAVKPQATSSTDTAGKATPIKVEKDKVTLSDEGKQLLAVLQDIDKEGKVSEKDKSIGDKVESFTYGALGMEHPNKIKDEDDSSYSAGQYLSAAATVGSLLLLLV